MQLDEFIVLICFLVGVAVVIGLVYWKRLWLESFDMLDWLHWVSILIGLAQSTFILWYYIPLIKWRDNGGYFSVDGRDLGDPKDKFISDFLFTDSTYRSVMTCFVALQLGVCALFVTRLRNTRGGSHWSMGCIHGPFMFCMEITLIVFAWMGWTILCAQYTSPEGGGMSKVHAIGVGVFISCSLAYVVMMSWNVYALFQKLSYLAYAEFSLLAILLLSSICLGIHFISNSLNKAPDAWVTEHLAFVLFVACHMLLFFIDSSHRRRSTLVSEAMTHTDNRFVSVFDGVRIQLPC